LSGSAPSSHTKFKLPEEYTKLVLSVLQRMIDDLECYLANTEVPEYRRNGTAAFNWIFQQKQNDKQVLSVFSVCYMIGCDVSDVRNLVLKRQESNDKLRARVIRSEGEQFSIIKIKCNSDTMPTSEPPLRNDGVECEEDCDSD
jgi:hypothetical protein